MEGYTKNYFEYYGFDISSFVPCRCCNNRAIEVHHIKHKSKFGKRLKWLQDMVVNLIAVCRECHDKAHDQTFSEEYLFSKIDPGLFGFVVPYKTAIRIGLSLTPFKDFRLLTSVV